MNLTCTERPSDSPLVELLWHNHSGHGGAFTSMAESHSSLVVTKIYGKTILTVRGPEIRATPAASPDDAEFFRAQASAYLEKLETLDREVRQAVVKIPPERRKVISTHDAFGYFSSEYGIRFIAPLGVSTETEPSARDIAAIISQIKAARIPAVFLENISDDRLIRRIAAETGAKVGGTLISDGLTGEKGLAPTYIDMVRHNIKALTSALDH